MGDNEIQEIFMSESQELLQNLETDVVKLEESEDPELINSIFRYVHTLKGSSGIAGYMDIHDFTHELEHILDGVRQGQMSVNELLVDIVLASIDWVKMKIFGAEGDVDSEAIKNKLLKQIDDFRRAEGKPPGSATAAEKDEEKEALEDSEETPAEEEEAEESMEVGYRYFRIFARFREDIFQSGIDPLMIMEDLQLLGRFQERKVVRSRIPDYFEMDPEKCYMYWDVILKTKHSRHDIDDVFLFVMEDNDILVEDVTVNYIEKEDDDKSFIEEKKIGEILVSKGILTEEELDDVINDQEVKNKKMGQLVVERGYATEKDVQFALGEQEKIKTRIETTTVRVDTRKLDNLMNLLGEIVIGQSAIARVADEIDDEDRGFRLKNAIYSVDRTTRDFQEQIMSIRMIPVGPTFEQFRRFVRDMAHNLGKQIKLDISGKETELDKTVIESIGDPLKHMIRNAIDHGIESPDERERMGKPREGHVRLNAYHQEGSVYIEISDDGKGINREKVRKKAESLGLLKKDEEVSDSRLFSFLFAPGFSTADNIGDLSGRGVGMDVVKTNIESLRGTVEIQSIEGKGTTVKIKLPLTLAIIEGMLVRVGKSIFIIPLLSILESIQPQKNQVKTVKGQGEVIQIRGEYISLVRTYRLFDIEPDYSEPWEGLVVVVESAGSQLGLMIDELLGQQQIVIKSLDSYITSTRSISGAAILGDGRVALIIDIHGLVGDIG